MRRPVRLLALLWAVLQVALPLGATLADAHAARTSAAVVAHVESGTTDGCQPVHAEDCVVCRTLGAMHGALGGVDCAAPRVAVAPRIEAPRVAEASGAPLPLPPSRAPPAL